MPGCKLEKKNWQTLIQAIQEDDCILILGPDVATQELDGQRRILTEILAEELVDEIEGGEGKKIDTSDLAQVTQYYCKQKGRISLKATVSDFYQRRENLCSNFHRIIAALPFYFVVVTSYDNMLMNALKEKEKKPVVERYHFKGKNPGLVTMGSKETPLIFNLYGSVSEPASLVLTENDLLDFLVELMSNKRPMPRNVLSELQSEDKCLLFLGIGFRHWYQRILLHVLQTRKKGNPSFAMEQFTSLYNDQLRQTVFFFQRSDYNVHIFDQDFDDFAAELKEKFVQTSSISISTAEYKKAPEIFICHANENKDFADFLHEKLTASGLNPWLDSEKLRGGDKWDLKIVETLEKVDYVLILQSYELAKKHRGYVIKEINCALTQQLQFRRGIRFIIPVIIDDSTLLDELKDLHAVDLRDKNNINKLLDTITRDFTKRGAYENQHRFQ